MVGISLVPMRHLSSLVAAYLGGRIVFTIKYVFDLLHVYVNEYSTNKFHRNMTHFAHQCTMSWFLVEEDNFLVALSRLPLML